MENTWWFYMGQFHNIINEGIDKIYKEDYEVQSKYISIICEDVRDMKPDIVFEASGFFVPNNEYMQTFFGPKIMDIDFDCYNHEGYCRWNNQLVLPLYNLNGIIVGLVGFNPQRYLEAKETKDKTQNYYSYSNKTVFDKGKYLFCLNNVYRRALKEGYLVITDGLFDTLSLAGAGYLSAALLGSSLSEEIIVQLRFINKVILAVDNDSAGLKLAERLSKHLNNLFILKQRHTKDVDDILKTQYRDKYLNQLDALINKTTSVHNMVVF